jgi:AcrR family transcriptional regulator
MKIENVKRARGRPRVFEKDEALGKALTVFWERGYDGATVAELTTALGINKPSLYAAFGNKEELFKQSLAKYLAGPAAFVLEAIKEPTARLVAEKFLLSAAVFLTDHQHPKGCMVVQGALSCAQSAEVIKGQLIQYRQHYEAQLAKRFKQAQLDGDLSLACNPTDLAKFLATLHQGMSVQATNGTTEAELKSMLKMALKMWPT